MVSIPVQSFRVVSTVLPALACIVTIFRLGVRVRSRLWWWDDTFALLAMLCIIVFTGGLWTHTANPDTLTRTNRIAAYYISALFFYSTNWAARLSILFTVVRIAPFPRHRRQLGIVAIVFVLAWAFLSAQTIWICESHAREWKDAPEATCTLGNQSGIAQLVLETLADILLVGIPIHFFQNTKLKKSVKVRLIAVFSTSAITTIAALIHGAFVVRFGGLTEATAAIAEDAVALAVCNLSVIIPIIVRLCDGESVLDPHSEDVPLSTMQGTFTGRPNHGVHVSTTVIIAPDRAPNIPVGLNTGDSVWQVENKDNSEDVYRDYDKTIMP